MKHTTKKYINQEMSAAETEGFEKEAITALLDRQLKNRWKAQLEVSSSNPTVLKPQNKLLGFHSVMLLAAGLALVVGMFVTINYYLKPNQTPEAFAQAYIDGHTAPVPATEMGTNMPLDISAATVAYYQGVKHLWEKPAQIGKAIQSLLAARRLGQGTVHSNDITFYLGLAYIKAGQKENAKTELLKLRRNDGTWIFPKAGELVELL